MRWSMLFMHGIWWVRASFQLSTWDVVTIHAVVLNGSMSHHSTSRVCNIILHVDQLTSICVALPKSLSNILDNSEINSIICVNGSWSRNMTSRFRQLALIGRHWSELPCLSRILPYLMKPNQLIFSCPYSLGMRRIGIMGILGWLKPVLWISLPLS